MSGDRSNDDLRRVQDQYERFPYPTPNDDLQPFADGRRAEVGFPRQFFHLLWPYRQPSEALDILIAGCGTSQAARYAAAHPKARITAVDISRACLDQTRALLQRHDLRNVSLERIELLKLADLNRQFDYIVCTGVIHHLPDPGAALDALRTVLRPEGSLYLMVYAPFGRDAIYRLQELLHRLGWTAGNITDEYLDQIGQLLHDLPGTHPLHFRRGQFPDLEHPSELVDYLLHARDRAFHIEELFQLLHRHGLQVQHLINRAHYNCERLPDGLIPAGIDATEQLAIGELYRCGIDKHEVFCVRDDRPPSSWQISFADTPAANLIPWQSPSLLTEIPRVDGRACLLARSSSHQFEDLCFVLNSEHSRILNAIDGARNLEAIHKHLHQSGMQLPIAKLRAHCQWLFERDLVFARGGN